MSEISTIEDRILDPAKPAFIIGEAGSNHDRSFDQARALVDVAADAGCDAIKFQLFEADKLVPLGSHAHSVLNPLEFPREWLDDLIAYCDSRNIIFCASPFDIPAVELLARHGAPFLKIASPEIHDIPLIRAAARTGRLLLVSTGMASVADIQYALEAIREEGGTKIVILHCTSVYPAEARDVNLRMMASIAATFDVPIGLSDHSLSPTIPAIAVALGARVIEKHFTIDRGLPGPDHKPAIDPPTLKSMVRAVREAEAAMGASAKRPLRGVEQLQLNNKTLMSAVSIPANTVITDELLTVKRAPGGIRPVHRATVIGRVARVDIAADKVIEWDMI